MIPFAIVCLGRTGSSHLVSLLSSHPRIHCAWEGTFIDPANADVRAALEKHVFSADKPVVGVKMPWEAINKFPEIFDIMRERNFRVIRLRRENLFDQYISMKLAQLSGVWLSDAEGYKVEPFVADYDYVKATLEMFELHNRILREATLQFQSVDVTYEEIANGRGLGRIFYLLKVEFAQLASQMKRQRRGRQADIVSNFAELKAAFAGSRFAHYFNG